MKPLVTRDVLGFTAPYVAVILFWTLGHNAWLAILAYHVQIVLWSRERVVGVARGWNARGFAVVTPPIVLAGPAMYLLLPHVTRVDLGEWLARYGLSGLSFLVMIPYFGVVHPILEQAHWSRLRERGVLAHALYAGYHAIVLATLLKPVWVAASVAVLLGASVAWRRAAERYGGLLIPACSHVFADLGMIIAAWALVQ